MASRDELLSIIDRAYEARCRGDKATVESFMAPGATFCLNGGAQAVPGVGHGDQPAPSAIGDLIDTFRFHSLERIGAVVEGDRAAIQLRIVVSAGDREPVTTEMLDLWTFDGDGKVTNLTEFADTAQVMRMLG